ncbi:MAG: hypothetical protein GC200_09270 [Tepidisphaera sp.]|nr:hypothetical protein [Tepidisphaera sp.]
MSDISGVSSNSGGGTAASGFSALSSGDFTKIILQELSHQDPLNTSDTNQLIQQLSGIRSIQSNTDLSDKLDQLLNHNDFTNASTLIGKTVSGLADDSSRVSGVVSTVSRTSKGTVVTLDDGSRVQVANLDEVKTTVGAGT